MPTPLHIDGDPIAHDSLAPREHEDVLAAERAGEPFIAFRDGQGRLELFVLGRERTVRTLGRHVDMDLSITWDSEVSGVHAELQCLGEEWSIVDDGLSTNGTYVEGRRVRGRLRLRDGDRIRVGHTILTYKTATGSSARRTVIGAVLPTPRTQTT